MQWAIGDWYNAIKGEGKQEACERVGLDYKNSQLCATVCSKFSMPARAGIPFVHHKVLSVNDLTDNQRMSLLKLAEKFTTSKHLPEG